MKRVAWTSDLHLNFCDDYVIRKFCKTIAAKGPDVVLVGGDIGEAPDVIRYLKVLEAEFQLPIYFVLGNHDFYRGSIKAIRHLVGSITEGPLHWLPEAGIVGLTDKTCLIGHGSWADGRLGDYENSPVLLNDYFLIEEFMKMDKSERLKRLNELGDEAAAYFEEKLAFALPQYDHTLIVTHVPPFRESCWYDGRISDDNYLPHFSCQAVGAVLRSVMEKHPTKQMTVLCGHTHGGGEVEILPNLVVKTADVEYGKPALQEMLVVD